ncbi:MAG: hypothetical protein DRP88_02515 [Candidatus Neomarinimicrobiota bacterium]|nr:MAG: hypothetical protein DRP88_02515 [Candidatus Neomarinimicrobiota bacterium]
MGEKVNNYNSSVYASIDFTISRFNLPPVGDALIVGKRTPIGPKALMNAINEMTPNLYKLINVDHPYIEAVIIKKSSLRKVDEGKLVPRIIKNVEKFMDETDSLHVAIDIKIYVKEEIQL